MRVRRPRRRWVGVTVTFEIASAGTGVPPTVVSSCGNDRNVATQRGPSKAPSVRAGSMYEPRSSTSLSDTVGVRRNPVFSARIHSRVSAAVIGRTSMGAGGVI